MPRPKLKVEEVWILQSVIPYDGSEIIGVFFDLDVAKRDRKWHQEPSGDWSTTSPDGNYGQFFLLSKHTIRTK